MKSLKISILLSLIFFIPGFAFNSPELIYVASTVFGIIYFYLDLRSEELMVNLIILYCLSMTITSIANFIGVLSFGKETEYLYNLYADPPLFASYKVTDAKADRN